MKLGKALLIADVQNDFCPGGALGIKDGDKIIPAVNKYIAAFSKKKLPVFLTRDWHPPKTSHFKNYGGVWPRHCVQGTKGALFHPKLKVPGEAIILSKGMDPKEDSYSAFQAVDQNGSGLYNLLKIFGVYELYVGGLATDYCVRHSCLDALRHGLKVSVLADAVKGVDLKPEDSRLALEQLTGRGAKTITLDELEI